MGNTSAQAPTLERPVLQKFSDATLCRPNILLFTRSQELIPIESVLRRPPKASTKMLLNMTLISPCRSSRISIGLRATRG